MRPLTILIVDDDADMRSYLRVCLSGFGPRIGRLVEAADGFEALPLLRSGGVDVVVADAVMPRLGGHGLRRMIRSDPQLRELPLLMVSGEDDGLADEGPWDAFLSKPFNTGRFREALTELLGRLPRTQAGAEETARKSVGERPPPREDRR